MYGETYYAIMVVEYPQGLDRITHGLKGQVYLGQNGKLCSVGNQAAFSTEEEARERIDSFKPNNKNRDQYKFEIFKISGTVSSRGSRLTPRNFYIAVLDMPESKLEKQPQLRKPLE